MTGSPNGSLKDETVLVAGRGSGLAQAIALAALDAGARVVAASPARSSPARHCTSTAANH
jgi:NAD(P)-dependent dehydrogenase (short-subunit alcohol dehydrogenase family)